MADKDSNIKEKNPAYARFIDDWQRMSDTYEGERAVKERGTEYLPPTAGMLLDGMAAGKPGATAYNAYLKRAVFHNFVADAVEAMLGFMHQQPPTIELPAQMEDLRERATVYGESLELLLRRINEQQLVMGRIGLYADLPATPQVGPVMPYIVTYSAKNIINWDDGTTDEDQLSSLSMVVLDETGAMRGTGLSWYEVEQYRVLLLGPLDDTEGAPANVYQVGVFRNPVESVPTPEGIATSLDFVQSAMKTPVLMGQTLDQIPFVFVNSKDIVPTPDNPPFLELANLCLAIYRLEADYRQTLHKQGQDTLVTVGARHRDTDDGEWRIGSGASIDVEIGGDAKFIGISADGIGGQRQALEDDKQQAQSKAGALLTNDNSNSNESGEALAIRVAARTATLTQIAKAGAAGLEKILRIIAKWRGLDPEQVKVTPNTDFAKGDLTGQDLVQLMTAKRLGAPISLDTVHEIMADRGLTSKTFDDELKEMESEEDLGLGLGLGTGTGAGGNPTPQNQSPQE